MTSEEYVCLECWEQLNDFHNFYTQVENAHITRNQQLKDEMEANDDPLHDNDSQDNEGVEDDDIKPEDLLDTLSEPEIEIGRETETPVEIKLELEVPSIEWLQEEEEEDDENNIEMIDDEDGDPSYQIEENSVSNDSHDVVIESNDTSPKNTAKPKPAKKSRRSRSKNPNLKPKSPALLKTKKEYLPRIEVEEYDNFLKKHFKMTCEKCEETFETFRDLCTHFGEVHDEQGYVYCCGEKFVNRPLLADHVNIHLNPEYFKCVLCGKVVNKRISLINHLKLHEEKHFSCDKCDKKFIQKYLLDKHLLRHLPPSEKKFQCQECGKR